MSNENPANRMKYFWRAILVVVAMLVLQNAIAFFVGEIVVIIQSASFTGDSLEDYYNLLINSISDSNFLAVTSLIYSVTGIIVFGLWFSKKRNEIRYERTSIRGWKFGLWPGIIIFAVSAQIVTEYLVSAIGLMFPKLMTDYADLIKSAGLDSVSWVMALYVIIFGPILEELVFRGLCLGYFRRSLKSMWIANICQAVLFGGMHMNVLQGIYAFLLGLCLGYVAIKTDSIMATILMHIAYNSSSYLIEFILEKVEDNAVTAFILILVGLLAAYFSIYMIIKSSPLFKHKI